MPRMHVRNHPELSTSESQGGVLQDRMTEAGIRYGEVVEVDIPHVAVDEKGQLFFCTAGDLTVRNQLSEGVELPIETWKLELQGEPIDVNVNRYTYGTLEGVVLANNGVIEVRCTSSTRFVPELIIR